VPGRLPGPQGPAAQAEVAAPGGHGGVVGVRVAQRLLALAAAVWFNSCLGARDKRSLLAYDH
jgi:hypothetical protein